ncbi:MAG: hypothetical protein LBC75_08590 [Fibromonadaceae bacterium]|jgi:antitoxin component of RelBE/YafQ-DinJ toxin-antitoxin module|nr:hypothetical protein [Fibromonadaceae bacterium]
MATLVQTRIDNKIKVGAERILKEPNEETMKAIKRVDRGEGLIKMTLQEFEEMLDKYK